MLRLLRPPPAADGAPAPETAAGDVIGGGIVAGVTQTLRSPYLLGIVLYMLLYTTTSTFLYFLQAFSYAFYSLLRKLTFLNIIKNLVDYLVIALLRGRLEILQPAQGLIPHLYGSCHSYIVVIVII